MKKSLSLASLLLATPALQAQDVTSLPFREAEARQPWLSFVATESFAQPRFAFEDGAQHLKGQELLLVTVELYPLFSSKPQLDPFLLSKEPPQGWQELELMFKVQNLTTGTTYRDKGSHYYALKKGSDLLIYDCDSTKTCDIDEDSQTVAKAVLTANEFRFVEASEYFYSPFVQWGPDPMLDPVLHMTFEAHQPR